MCALWVYHEHMTPFIDDRSMNMTFCNQSFLCSRGLVMVCRAMLEPDTAPLTTPEEVDSGSAMIDNLQMNWHLSFLTISVARHITFYLPVSLSPWFFANSQNESDHQTIASEWTAPHRTASHRTINTALSRYCKLLTAPCYSAYCLLSATPSSATPAPRHSFPPPVAP